MPPLIEIKVLLENSLEVKGLYDPGSRITVINAKLLNKKFKREERKFNIKTISGQGQSFGLVKLNARIDETEKNIHAFVYENENFKYDLILGLDSVKKFGLTHDKNLNIKLNNTKQIDENNNRYEVNFNEFIDTTKFEIDTNHLEDEKKRKIDNIVNNYKGIFAKDKYDVGEVKNYEAFIDLQIDRYCYKRPYRCSIEDRKEIEGQISKLLKRGLIEDSYSPFAAPVTLAFKKEENKKNRLCVDFRELNKIVVPQAQPFPLIEDIMIRTVGCKYFTTLDINSAFWSIPLRVGDRSKTGFITQEGHYQWRCLPYGLKTSPAIFQRILVNIIKKYNLSEFCTNYIDDIIIFSKTFEDHLKHIELLLDAIKKEGLKLKFTKCKFAKNEVKYLGHLIKNDTITPLKDNIKSITNFNTPKNKKNIRQFLGKINFERKYVPKITEILEPLHNQLKKNIKFDWSDECKDAFNQIKEILSSEPVLAIFNPKSQIYIYTDASTKGLGAILKQPQANGEMKPVAYFSKKLNEPQKKKKAIFLECLAIKESIKFWQYWLIGRFFTIYSDHKPLENLNVKNRTDEELGDMVHYISQYNCVIKYNPGKNNGEADLFSRNPVLEPEENIEDVLKTVNIVTIDNITLQEIIDDQKQNERITQNTHKFLLEDGVYYKKFNSKKKIILSEKFSKTLIQRVHKNFGHTGMNQTKHKINSFYTAPNLTKNIEYLKNCEICIKNKTRLNRNYGLMSHLGPAERPFQIMSLDTIGGFGGQRSTKKYLHLLEDHFTRFAYILCSKNQTTTDFINLLKKVPPEEKMETILTDQYPGISSKELENYVRERGAELIFTAVDAPFSNGLNERLNQTLVNKIRCTLNENTKKVSWATVAEECRKKYNATDHSITGFSPDYLINGESTDVLPAELKNKERYKRNLEEDRNLALLRTRKSHDYNKSRYDKNRINYEFEEGDMVYIMNKNKLNRKKLEEIRTGPFKIEKKISNSIYKISTNSKRSTRGLYHITKLIPIEV